MRKGIQSALLLIMIFIPGLVRAGDITDNSMAKLMALSGLNKQVGEFPGMVRAGMEQANKQDSAIPAAEFREMQMTIEGSFQPSEILRIIAIEVKKNMSESEAQDLLKWYESDLGRKITKAEEDASTPAAYQNMIREAQSLLADEKRVKQAKMIDNLVNATDMMMQLQENTGIAVLTAITTVANQDQQVNIAAFKAQMAAREPQIRAQLEQLVIVSFLYSYKDIDMTSIERYITFLERATARKMNDGVIKGMKYALNQSVDNMAKSLTAVFKKYNEKVNKPIEADWE